MMFSPLINDEIRDRLIDLFEDLELGPFELDQAINFGISSLNLIQTLSGSVLARKEILLTLELVKIHVEKIKEFIREKEELEERRERLETRRKWQNVLKH